MLVIVNRLVTGVYSGRMTLAMMSVTMVMAAGFYAELALRPPHQENIRVCLRTFLGGGYPNCSSVIRCSGLGLSSCAGYVSLSFSCFSGYIVLPGDRFS